MADAMRLSAASSVEAEFRDIRDKQDLKNAPDLCQLRVVWNTARGMSDEHLEWLREIEVWF